MRSTFNSSTTRWAACATRSSMTTVTPMAVPRRPSRSRVCRKRRVPGTSVVAIGGGSYAGQSAMAVGLSTYAGRWIFKASGSTNTRGAVAAGVGAGYAW
ncbi:YadA C-terminal domain-containing protein [Burkholderia sp. MSMB1588]|uniref:YadA C-terminal domain-containing protein n=1 Tax=unclassified Burkholderia TaxID=2613784 RepID=UPI0032B7BB8F